MTCIDQLDEFRVLGGDPFMNKSLYKIINKLTTYDKVNKVVIYTNARIVPKGENLEALRHKKVLLDITNYGVSSTAHDKLVELCKKENLLGLILIAPLAALSAPFGAKYAHSLPKKTLTRLFAIFLLFTSIRMYLELF